MKNHLRKREEGKDSSPFPMTWTSESVVRITCESLRIDKCDSDESVTNL